MAGRQRLSGYPVAVGRRLLASEYPMATTPLQTELTVSPTIRSLLGSLRVWILVYVWAEGLVVAATWLGVAFWGNLAIDWFFEPPSWVRVAMLGVVGLVLAGVLVHLIGRRAVTPLTNSNMAMVLERRFPHLNDSLLTAVVLTDRIPHLATRKGIQMPHGGGWAWHPRRWGVWHLHTPAHCAPPTAWEAECNRQMLAHTCREAAERIEQIELRSVFNPLPLQRAVVASVLLCVSVVAFACLFPDALDTWFRRSLLLAEEPWPRRVGLSVEGFAEGVEKVARGADLEIIARADTRKELPARVQVRYRVEGGRRDRKPMTRLGAADPAKDRFQEYSYTFPAILDPIRFDVIGEVKMGRDVCVPDLRIEVVESPTLDTMTLHCRYPSYMGRQPRSLPVTGEMPIPQGTKVTVHATANKDLVGVRVDCTAGQRSVERTELQRHDLADDGRSFSYMLPRLDENTTLVFTLSDTDGITGREPVRLSLAAVADYPPQLTARLEGIGAAITPQARLPAAGQVTDDYGVAKTWFEYTIDQQEPAAYPLSTPADHPTNLSLDGAVLEVRELKSGTDRRLVAGQKLLVGVKAADLCDLAGAPNVGSSERWLLDLVTPEQLRAMLESRELVLRQRFEAIIEEVTETRDLLLRIDFGTADADKKTEKTAAEEKTDRGGGHVRMPYPPTAGGEPGDEPEQLSPERQLALRTLRVQRGLTNSSKNAHETEGVADGFDDIRLQLINNRIDTEELIHRLQEGIANPLHHVAREMFPRLQTRLERLQESLDDEKLGPQRRDLAREQADAVLLEMRKALDRMIELEDFNEAVELLRTIIKLQEDLGEQTTQRHKQRIRGLLEGKE
jgi:hypothetical protein